MNRNKVADKSDKKYSLAMKGIGRRIEELRMAQTPRWSQGELAKHAGINIETIVRMESDRNTSIEKLEKVARAFGVTIGDLLPEDEYPESVAPSLTAGEMSLCVDPDHAKLQRMLDEILHSDASYEVGGESILVRKGIVINVYSHHKAATGSGGPTNGERDYRAMEPFDPRPGTVGVDPAEKLTKKRRRK